MYIVIDIVVHGITRYFSNSRSIVILLKTSTSNFTDKQHMNIVLSRCLSLHRSSEVDILLTEMMKEEVGKRKGC